MYSLVDGVGLNGGLDGGLDGELDAGLDGGWVMGIDGLGYRWIKRLDVGGLEGYGGGIIWINRL